jgi:cell division protein FtsL
MDSAYSIAAAVILVIVTTLYFLAKRMKNQQNLQAIEEQIRQEKELVERLNRLRD